jgi:hypothetical protein
MFCLMNRSIHKLIQMLIVTRTTLLSYTPKLSCIGIETQLVGGSTIQQSKLKDLARKTLFSI